MKANNKQDFLQLTTDYIYHLIQIGLLPKDTKIEFGNKVSAVERFDYFKSIVSNYIKTLKVNQIDLLSHRILYGFINKTPNLYEDFELYSAQKAADQLCSVFNKANLRLKESFISLLKNNNKKNKSFFTQAENNKSYYQSSHNKTYYTYQQKSSCAYLNNDKYNEKLKTIIRNNSRNGQIKINTILPSFNETKGKKLNASTISQRNPNVDQNISLASKIYLNYTKKRWQELHSEMKNLRTNSAKQIRTKNTRPIVKEGNLLSDQSNFNNIFSKLKKKNIQIREIDKLSNTVDVSKYLLNSTISNIKY